MFSVDKVDDAQRLEYIAAYQDHLLNLERSEPIQSPILANYDRDSRRKLAHKRVINVT